ncbi:MAG: Fe-S cluster assembly protein SufD [Burkholderiales bacterium]|nr:Fe-S cluster assembly protein SufD [Phycisphaerae bacterium]
MTQVADEIGRKPMTEGPISFQRLRTVAREHLLRSGRPTGKEESWRFTQIQPILRTQFAAAGRAEAGELFDQYTFGGDAGVELVFVNGFYSPDLSRIESLPRGLSVNTLADAAANGHAAVVEKHLGTQANLHTQHFAAVNTANLRDGAFVHIKRSTTVDAPIHLLFITIGAADAVAAHPRVLVVTEDNVEATIVESYVGAGANYLCNAVTEVVCGADCRIDHCKLQQESPDGFHTAVMQVEIGRQTQFVSHAISIGARISRNDLGVKLAGQASYATLNGLVLISGNQHCDNHTLLDHAAPDCPSHELYKHVLSDKSSAVFKGQIFVHRVAQKTNAKQSSKALLLSDTASMNSMPALEIYADDVKCTHGSTIGPIDDDLIFYLRSRGVGIEAARHLLTYAFAADVTRRIKVAPVRRRVEDFMAVQHGLPQDLRINDLGAFDSAVTR